MGRMGRPTIDITGRRYGRLVAICESHRLNDYKYWKCQCDCGTITYVEKGHLTNGLTKSCGCLRNEKSRERIQVINIQRKRECQQRFLQR